MIGSGAWGLASKKVQGRDSSRPAQHKKNLEM